MIELAIPEERPTGAEAAKPAPASLPDFEIEIAPPDLSRACRDGNCGVPGFTSFAADATGPHVVIMALIHGNELAGAVALAEVLAAGFRPRRGRLTLGFANLAAFDRFDRAQPTASRFIDEDLNRLWDDAVLDGPRKGSELARARQMRSIIDSADLLLDLHSMLWPSEPLVLCGSTEKGRVLARGLGTPDVVVADEGHVSGRRLIDYGRFAEPSGRRAAILVEAGQHWQAATLAQTRASIAAMLHHCGMSTGAPPRPPANLAPRFARVTQVVTASTASFAFTQPWRGGDVVARRGTLIAIDGDAEIRTPHDDCLLVMPSLRTGRGHTAVRLARFEA